MTARLVKIVLVLLVLGVAGCDQATKHWAEGELAGKPPTSVIAQRVDLEYAQNRGIAFNLERVIPPTARKPLVLVAGLALLSILSVAAWRRRGELSMHTVGTALVIGGAVGNLADRLTRGYVVDFVHIHGWPIFNIADVAVVAGAAMLILATSRSRSTSSPPSPPSAA
jgi:signal peptidase II